MKRFVVLDKKVGETPLMAVQEWKRQNQEYISVPASYAGRLDPMASGKLLILLGDECKRQKAYTNLDKEYETEVLLGVGSDTGDVLGMPTISDKHADVSEIKRVLDNELGAHSRSYPAFSSKTVNGKPLFLHTLEGSLSHMEVPEHVERIFKIKNVGTYTVSNSELERRVLDLLALVPRTDEPSKRLGEDFRVDAIREQWRRLFQTTSERNFTVLRLDVVCASGTYMRSLSGRIGESLDTKALALSIRRTKIGKYVHLWCGLGCWVRSYK